MDAHVALLRVVEHHLILVERLSQLLVHVCETESFPEVCSADLLVSHISDSKKWVITHGFDFDETLFHDVFSLLGLSCIWRKFLGHLLSSDTDQVDVKVKAKSGLESDVDLFL